MPVPPRGSCVTTSSSSRNAVLTTQVLSRNLQTERFLSFLRVEFPWGGWFLAVSMGLKLDRELGRSLASARPYNWIMRCPARFPSGFWWNFEASRSQDIFPGSVQPPRWNTFDTTLGLWKLLVCVAEAQSCCAHVGHDWDRAAANGFSDDANGCLCPANGTDKIIGNHSIANAGKHGKPPNGDLMPQDSGDCCGPAAFVAALAELCRLATEALEVPTPRAMERSFRPRLKVQRLADFKNHAPQPLKPSCSMQGLLDWWWLKKMCHCERCCRASLACAAPFGLFAKCFSVI